MQNWAPAKRFPPLPEDGETAEVEILLAEGEADDISLASAHTPTDEVEESEQEEEELPPPTRRRAVETASTADSSPPPAAHGEDSGSSSPDTRGPRAVTPLRTASPAKSPSFEACLDYDALMLSDDEGAR